MPFSRRKLPIIRERTLVNNFLGLVNPQCLNLIGSGVVIHVPSFFYELETIQKKGLDTTNRIFVSDRAHLVFDLHQKVDGLEENALGTKEIGTTKKGIGPTYSTKASRSGIRVYELFHWEAFEKKLRGLAVGYRKRYGDLLEYDVEGELERYKVYYETLRPYVVDAVLFVQKAFNANKRVLVEGANALMLDIDYGTYPYVTSSNTGIGGVITGLAISPFKIKAIIGVVKAYTTRVGGGPFPTEQLNVSSVYIDFTRSSLYTDSLSINRKLVTTSKRLAKNSVSLRAVRGAVDGLISLSSSTRPP